MIELTNEGKSYLTGHRTRFWTVVRDGVALGQLAKADGAFTEWRFIEARGGSGVYERFPSKGKALEFLETFRAR